MRVFVTGETGAVGGHAVPALVAAGRRSLVRGPGRLALLLGARTTSLTRSIRGSNDKLRSTTPWAPRYPSAREELTAMAAELP